MKFARLAGLGAASALATTGLVGATSTPAHAAPVTSTYSCTASAGTTPFNLPVSVDLALPPSAVAGAPVPAGLLSFATTATVPGAVQTAPGGPDSLSVTGARSADFGTTIGDAVVKAPAKWTKPGAANGAGDFVYTGTGVNGALVLPKAGTYAAAMPKSFSLIGTNAGGADTSYTATCTTASPATVGSITLSKQTATVKAKAPKSAKKGAVVSVKGKVLAEFAKAGGPTATGKVVVKDGKKKVGTAKLEKGKYVVKVKGLAKGKHTLVVSYKGDGYVGKASSKALTVKVA
jgi:hypothetical protein